MNKKSKIEKYQESDSWQTSYNETVDTIWLRGCLSYDSVPNKIVCDTVLTGEALKNSWDFPKRIKTIRVPFILNGRIIVNTDSLILMERMIGYFLNGIPIKLEVFDHTNKKNASVKSVTQKNRLIYNSFFAEDELNPYKIDTVSWNNDTTEIKWSSTHFEWKQTDISKYQIHGNELQISFNDTTNTKITYLESESIFKIIMIDNLLYSDCAIYMGLRYFDREKVVSKNSAGLLYKNEYTYDNQNRIIEMKSYENDVFYKRVEYKYE